METYKVTIELTNEDLMQAIAALTYTKMKWEQEWGVEMKKTTKVLEKLLKAKKEIENSPF